MLAADYVLTAALTAAPLAAIAVAWARQVPRVDVRDELPSSQDGVQSFCSECAVCGTRRHWQVESGFTRRVTLLKLGNAGRRVCQPLHSLSNRVRTRLASTALPLATACSRPTQPTMVRGSGLWVQVESQYPLWAAGTWAAANIIRWQRSRPVLGPLLHLWWEETRRGHRRDLLCILLRVCAALALKSNP